MTAACPKGHESTDTDFCSECGIKIASPPTAAPQCPDCYAEKSAPDAKFCEICGYNYETGARGQVPVETLPLTSAQTAQWTLQISVDPTLKQECSPDAPADFAPQELMLNGDVLLIGRKSASRNVAPEVSLDFDSAVSHRHAILTHVDADRWTIRDIGSSNGTRLNGKDLQPMVDAELKPGDRIALGHWTCLLLNRQ